jgi:hypothetical protein
MQRVKMCGAYSEKIQKQWLGIALSGLSKDFKVTIIRKFK